MLSMKIISIKEMDVFCGWLWGGEYKCCLGGLWVKGQLQWDSLFGWDVTQGIRAATVAVC